MQLIWTLSLLALGASALPSVIISDPDPKAIVDEYLFELPLQQFIERRTSRDPPTLIWDSDGCSHAPENPLHFPFNSACQRHDFGYRNYKQQDRFNSETKERIDRNFKDE